MGEFVPSILMAIMDFFPVFIFLFGGFYLLRYSYGKLDRVIFSLQAAGIFLVFFGGFYKALWKLIYAWTGVSLVAFSESQFLFLAPGFLLLFLSSIFLLGVRKPGMYAVTATSHKMPLLLITTLTSIGFLGVMARVAFKEGIKRAGFLYLLALVLMVTMGWLGTREQTENMNWLAQSVNTVGQLALAGGHYSLYSLTKNVHKEQVF